MQAQNYMRYCCDPIHDLGHATRVVENVQKIGRDMKCSSRELDILEIAAWWHDVGRSIIKKPSVWMIFFDDIISACSLLCYALKFRTINPRIFTAIKLIFCHSFGIGKFFSKILLRKRNRILLDILTDADNIDLFVIERFELIRNFSLLSTKNEYIFRFMVWMSLNTRVISTKTAEARKYLKQIITNLLTWTKNQEIYSWLISRFGDKWTQKTVQTLTTALKNIIILEKNNLSC